MDYVATAPADEASMAANVRGHEDVRAEVSQEIKKEQQPQ